MPLCAPLRVRVVLFALAAALCSAGRPSAAPRQSAAPAPPQSPVFRSGVELARMDFQATDRAGRPVDDLTAKDVQVVENGAPRPILIFQHVAESGRSYLDAAQRTIASEVSTNQGAPRGELYVLLFDQDHITSGAEQRVRLAAERFLRRQLRPEDRVAIFGLPGPGPALTFTSNLQTALDQLQFVRGDLDRTPASVLNGMTTAEAYQIFRNNEQVLSRQTEQVISQVSGSDASIQSARNGTRPASAIVTQEDRASVEQSVKEDAETIVRQTDAVSRHFLGLTADLLRSLRGVDGRKTVLLFSEGFYADNIQPALQQVAAAAAESYSIVYAFDLNQPIAVDISAATPDEVPPTTDAANRVESIGGLASATNGALVPDAIDHLDQALGALGAANRDYYVVGFAPSDDAGANPSGYHPVQIRVTRPGVSVSARSGYASAPPVSPADRRQAIDAALAAPFTQQGLHVDYTTYVSRADLPGVDRVAVSLDAALPLAATGAPAPSQHADVVFVVRDDRTGAVVASGTDAIPLPTAPASGATTGRGDWRVQFTVPPGDYLMRCVVREPGGLVGSADRLFTARPLSGPDVAASDLILASPDGQLPVRALGYTDAPLAGAVRVYARSAAQLEDLSATLALVPVGGDAAVVTVAGVPDAARPEDPGVSRDVMFNVPLAGVSAGQYVGRVSLRTNGEVLTELRREVDVVAGAPPPPPAPAMGRARDVLDGVVAQRLLDGLTADAAGSDRRALGFVRSGRWEDALRALPTAPASAATGEAPVLRGLALLGAEQYAAAARELGAAFAAAPDNAALAFVLGWARIGAGDQTGAITAFRNAVLHDPTMMPAHLALAETYLRLRQPALARQVLVAGLTALPDSIELKRLLETIR